jgi:hypothetical protein
MLIDIDTGKPITRMPFAKEFQTLRERLTADEFNAAVSRVNELIDAGGAEIATAGWLPGSDWRGTVFFPIFTNGTKENYEKAAQLFGLLVWHVVMQRQEQWGSGRYEKNGKDIGSRTYFRLGVVKKAKP